MYIGHYNAKQYGIPQCVHSLNVPGLCFHIWPDGGSFEPKHVAEFLILITKYIVVLLTGINYCIITTYRPMYIQGSDAEIQVRTQRTMIGRRMTAHRPCYRPAVFFSHLRLIALPFPRGNKRHFKKILPQFFYFLKIRKYEIA